MNCSQHACTKNNGIEEMIRDHSTYIYDFQHGSMAFIHYRNKRSFRGPGGVVRELDSVYQAKICAPELASVVSRGPPVVSRGLPSSLAIIASYY